MSECKMKYPHPKFGRPGMTWDGQRGAWVKRTAEAGSQPAAVAPIVPTSPQPLKAKTSSSKRKPVKTPNPRRQDEEDHYATLLNKLDDIRDAVHDVIRGRATGLYIFGRGGTSKTHTVMETFDQHDPGGYVYENGGLTPQGLFELLQANGVNHANRHIIIDDVYETIATARSRQYYLAALARPKGNMERKIPYAKEGVKKVAIYGKGIVLIANCPLAQHKNEVIQAMEDRVIVLEHDPADAEVWALIYKIAEDGKSRTEHIEIADFLFDVCAEYQVRPSVRLFCDKAIPIYEAWKARESKKHWKDRLRSVVARRAVEPKHIISLAEHTDDMMEKAQEAWEAGKSRDERVKIFFERTGKSRATAYRYWQQLGLVRR